MILAALALGGALLSISSIAGLLMVYQLRQTTDLENSTRAIMAADSGMEWGLYQYFQVPQSEAQPTDSGYNPYSGWSTYPLGISSVEVSCYALNSSALLPNCSKPSDPSILAPSVQAVGSANAASRAFRLYFQLFVPS